MGRTQGGKSRALRRIAAVGAAVAATAAAAPAASAAQQPTPRILGGAEVGQGQASWVMAITDSSGKHFCGGALVSPTKVVTAAHCAVSPVGGVVRPASDFRVVGGRVDLRTAQGEVRQVERVWVPPTYRHYTEGDDIAVFTLRAPMPQRPVPLVEAADTEVYRPGALGRVYGWGTTSEGGPGSPTLRSVALPVVPDGACQQAYPSFAPTSMFCAGYPEGGKDACAGDSGGPFVVNGRLAGVVSFGTGCGRPGMPGVYTRVAGFLPELSEQL